jgi:adenosine kinase
MDFTGKFEDHIIKDKIHELSVSFNIDQLEKNLGGTAGNIAHNLKLLKNKPIILAPLGYDGKEYIEKLQNKNISTEQIPVLEDKITSSAHITTDKKDNQITAFHNGALSEANRLSIKNLNYQKLDYAILSPFDPEATVKFATECKEIDLNFNFDPGQQVTSFSKIQIKECIQQAHSVIGNDYEIQLIKEKSNLSESDILNNVEFLIETKGPEGSVIKTEEDKIEIDACHPDEVLDPTGAGDAYRAGFFASLLQDLDLETCGQVGSTAASFAIEEYGSQNHKFSKEKFQQRFNKNYGKNLSKKLL